MRAVGRGVERRSLLLLCVLLLAGAARAACAHLAPAPRNLALPAEGPPSLVPDLARDGADRLAWLPGLGQGGAAAVVAARPGLGAPLSLDTLPLVPGIGAETVREVAAFYARVTRPQPDPRPDPPPAPDR